MARFVCSAKVLDTIVRQAVGSEGSCLITALPLRTILRSARPLSTRYHLAFKQTSTTKDEVTNVTSWQVSDSHVPIIDNVTSDHVLASAQRETRAGWPLPNSSSTNKGDLTEAEFFVDENALQRLLAEGLPRGSPPEHHHKSQTENQINSAELESDPLAPRQEEAATGVTDNVPGSRTLSRKARKVRRLEAKLQAVRSELAQNSSASSSSTYSAHISAQSSRGTEAILTPVDDEASQINAILQSDKNKDAPPRKPKTVTKSRAERSVKPKQVVKRSSIHTSKDTGASAEEQEAWRIQKAALEKKFSGQGWQPRKRISPDAIAGVRSLNANDPVIYSTDRLADFFQISPEAVRRILKSKWQPNEKQAEERRARWERRGEKKWSEMVEQGVRPPKKWREMGIGRAPRGELPAWKRGGRPRAVGERWIEHRSPEELFARAAEQSAETNNQRFNLPERIL
ncbi:Neugrin-like protein [Elsinoe fawcettii]|nr:Neugrin-like protein [Elsinoe fawcettii]